MDKRIGMIGLGQMGKWMALNMLKREFDLTVLDINPAALTSLTGEGGRAGQIIVDLGTSAYMTTLELGRRLEEKGIHFADSPVSGMEA
ncbi:MAG: NAD(P)-dependent oxidoreductase, partial [Proteobacteria bacterium]|nr:NAD(P)-dependent oxidoreductase [Pseudomonadota bacterium]